MGRSDYFKKGDYNALCDQCSFKYKASELRRQWDNLMVCQQCYEKRNPQDFVRGVKDSTRLPWTRPEPADNDIQLPPNPFQNMIGDIGDV